MRACTVLRFGAAFPILLSSVTSLNCAAHGAECPPTEAAVVARDAAAAGGAARSEARSEARSDAGAVPKAWARVLASRRPVDDEPMVLGFKDAPMDQVLRFIVESTGKTLMTRLPVVSPTKITLISDRPLPRSECLDRVYEAMANSNLAVIEDHETIWIDLLSEIVKSPRSPLVVAAGESIDAVSCNGLVTSMVLPLHEAKSPTVVAQLRDFVPDFAIVVFDAERNQLLVRSTVGSAKQIRRLAEALDGVATVDESTHAGRWTHIPTRSGASGRERVREPLSTEAIEAMSSKQLREALQDVSRTRQRTDLSDDVRSQLKREFDALLNRLKEKESAGR